MADADDLVDRLAREEWERLSRLDDPRPRPARPLLAVMVGVPLSGKSTLARAIAADARTVTVIVENDAVRERVAAAMGRAAPRHDRVEHRFTYRVAWGVLRLALASGVNVIHDATNLDDPGRRGAYDAADHAGADVLVVFVLTDPELVQSRADASAEHRRLAHAALGRKRPNPDACSRERVVVDGGRDVHALATGVLDADAARALTAAGRTSS